MKQYDNSNSVMESRDHFKNGARRRSRVSRSIFLVCVFLVTVAGYFVVAGCTMQVKKAPTAEAAVMRSSNEASNSTTQEESAQNESKTKIAGKSVKVPPIENSKDPNARVLLPKNWDGKSILANAIVWINDYDKAKQNKYNRHYID